MLLRNGTSRSFQKEGIKNLVFTGCTTSVCVDSTIRDAMFRDCTCLLLARLHRRADRK